MKISELISELEVYRKQEGDLEVFVNLPLENKGFTPIDGAHLRGNSTKRFPLPDYFVVIDWV